VISKKGIKIIFSIWGHREGWVFVPAKNHTTGKWKEKGFRWPDERQNIMNFIEHCIENRFSIYWCPTVFREPKRVKENVESKINVLWADLDKVHPAEIELRPTIAWESSPGRYQCLWLLKKSIPAKEAEGINKDLTYSIGADKGGWDLTQVLRIPGLRNWKYKDGPNGRLLWDDGNIYSPKTIKKNLTNHSNNDDNVDEPINEDVMSILSRYSKNLNKRVYELFFTPDEEVSVGERSDRLWELECLLAESGVRTKDIITLVKLSPWNKFKGRRNEDEQIENEVYKAKDKVKSLGRDLAVGLGPNGVSRICLFEDYDKIISKEVEKPEWLIESIWQDKGHGIVAGEPKTYKSILTTDIAVSVASGKDLLGRFRVVNQGNVLIIQEENHPYLVKDRLLKIANSKGLLEGDVKFDRGNRMKITFPPILPIRMLNQYGFNMTNEEHRELIQEEIKRYKPVLTIFDPLYLMLGNADVSSEKDLRPILNWLLQLRYAYNTGIMVVHHWNKGGTSTRGGQRMLGSATLHAWVESALYCSVKNEIEHSIHVEREFRSFPKPHNIDIKFNMGDPGILKYEPEVTDSSMVTIEGLINVLRGTGGLSEREILKYTDWPRRTLRNILEKAEKKGIIEKIGGGKGRGKSTIFALRINSQKQEEEFEEGD
jgi:hypothetical protein